MCPGEIENDGDTVLGKVVVVTPVVKSFRIILGVVPIVEGDIIQTGGGVFVNLVEILADHVGADNVDTVRSIPSHHINIEISNCVIKGNKRLSGVML